MKKLFLTLFGCATACVGVTQEIGYIETFSLAKDRAAALKELVPGTDDFYYYHALQAQNTGDRAAFKDTMDRWVREHRGTVVDRARELLNRQALLDYPDDPQGTLAYLRSQMPLFFNHVQKTGERVSTAPTALSVAILAADTRLQHVLSYSPGSLDGLEDAGLRLVAGRELTGEQRRSLLARLRRPDYPGIVDLIAADLSYRDSRGFGSLPVHSLLTLEQMDELVKKVPVLRDESAFVRAYLSKLAPTDETDLDTDAAARGAYYDRVWAFVQTLAPVHNSLKANVLYNRLRHDLTQGVRDRDRFMVYVRLPRDVNSIRPEYRRQVPRADQFARLGQDFGLTALPPVPREEPLVRTYLLTFFKKDAGFEAFRPYFRDEYLKPLFAEAKIVNGEGDLQQWAPLLSPDAYRRLKERVDIDFAPDNPAVVGSADAVCLTAFIKNVPVLIVNVYEINTFNYYRETGQPLNLAINLDGLVASFSRRQTYDTPPERREARTFDLPELKGRGVYVAELIGNGKSSRALVQKGALHVMQDVTAAGHAFTVLDETGQRVTGASGWLGGRSFAADKEGRILIPFSTAPKQEALVVRAGSFATLVRFDHLAERYALKAGVYVDREALIRREKASIAVRPLLTVNGRPVGLDLLEKPQLIVRATDLQGVVTVKEFPDLTLRENAETVAGIQVPENCVRLDVTLKARIENLSRAKKEDLSDSASFPLNGIERTADIQTVCFGKTAAGYYAEVRGKNGEPLAGEPLVCGFKHRLFRDEIHAQLKTAANGRATLGALTNIERVRLCASAGRARVWTLPADACDVPAALHGRAGEVLRIPLTRDPNIVLTEASLLESRLGQFVKDWHTAFAVTNGFLELRGLPAGDYSLSLGTGNNGIPVRITAGAAREGYAVSAKRALELPRLAPLNATVAADKASLVIRVTNATPFCRVHVFATRYLPDYDLFDRLGFSSLPAPTAQMWQPVRTFYESGRDIGDEYRYILDRRQAVKYPGNMLARPGLLLNPWALRATEAETERLAEGNAYAGRQVKTAQAVVPAEIALRRTPDDQKGYGGIDFLRQPAVEVLNLQPDKTGTVTVPRASLKDLPFVRVLAVDPAGAVLRCTALDDSPVATRELRLADGLDPKKQYAERKVITPLEKGAAAVVADVTTARFKTCDTVAEAYRLLATLHPDATFDAFAFAATWPDLDAKEQRRLYSIYACHELNFFLYHKDRPFFDAVIAPYLRNKRDQTFMDHWLLGDDLSGYLTPWRFGRLNAAERALLGKRLAAQATSLARDAHDRAALAPQDPEAFNHCFDTALQAGSLAAGDVSEAEEAVDAARKNVLYKKARALSGALPAAAPVAEAPAKQLRFSDSETRANVLSGSKSISGAVLEQLRRKIGGDKAEVAADEAPTLSFFDAKTDKRAEQRRFFQKLDKTQEWAENNYYHLPVEQQTADLVTANAFWADYAANDGKTPFLSNAFIETAGRFTEMMLALSVMDLPFKAGTHGENVEGVCYTLTAASPALLFRREIRESKQAASGGVLVAQHVFRADDRDRIENGERSDKAVTDEFLPHVVYGARVVMTNPTDKPEKLHALFQIPAGAIPVKNGFYTRGVYVALEPYSTQTREYFFYFPATGDYPQYPATLASDTEVAGRAEPFVFHVVERLSRADTASWAWLSQNGTEEQVLAFLKDANLHRINLSEIAWRMKNQSFFKQTLAVLDARHMYNDTLWSYGVLHNIPAAIREFLQHSAFAKRCGLWLDSPLLTLDPVERFDYQHLEYAPLVNPRVHPVGAARTILNARFREQYQRFMKVLSYKPKLNAEDTLAVTYYLTLQDRVGEALDWFGRVDRKAVAEQLPCDYMAAYLAFYTGKLDQARALAKKHAAEGVDRWRERFVQVAGQLDEIAGGAAAAADREKRDQAQDALAASEAALDFQVEAGRIRLDTRNVARCTLNFYPMDIELLFSRSPFMQEGTAQFSFVRPVESRAVVIPAGRRETGVDLPAAFKTKNVMVEALAGGVRRTQAYYANTLKVQTIESYGQLAVTHAETGKPVAGAYVKVYARMKDGKVRFFKDGYTDMRGRFDYVSLNTNELEDVERLSVLVLSDDFGAVVREVPPPKR